MIDYTCTLPPASDGCRMRRVRVRCGRKLTTHTAGLDAGEFRFSADPDATAHVLEFDSKRRCTRGPRLELQSEAPPAIHRVPDANGAKPIDVRRLRKDQLIGLAEERGIAMSGTETKDELVTLLTK